MARPRPISYRQDVREHDQHQGQPQDWHELRSDLLELLGEVDRQEFEDDDAGYPASQPRRKPSRNSPPRHNANAPVNAPRQDRHRRALHSVAETLERFGDRGKEGISSAIEQIRERHAGVPNRRGGHAEDYQNSVQEMNARLENLGRNLKNGDDNVVNNQDITNQLAQLTHTVELLAGAVGESGQVRRLESQIAGLAEIVTQAPERGQTELNQRLERLSSSVEQMSEAQYQLTDRPVAMIEELSGAQERGFGAVEAGVRGIYDRIDNLEQSISVNPSDIDRLSADMRELVRSVQAGTSDGTLLSKIDTLNTRMNGIEGGGGVAGALGGDIETLRDAVRDAIEPRFFEINSKIDTLDGKLKSNGGGKSVELEDHVRQLIARMDQTGTQLSEMAKFRSDNPDASPDLTGLADLVAERTSKAVSQSTKSAFAKAGSFDERVHEGMQQVDARLARLEETLKSATSNRKATIVATKPAGAQKLTPTLTKKGSAVPAPNAVSPSAPSPIAPEAQTPAPAASSQPAVDETQYSLGSSAPRNAQSADARDTMRMNPSDDKPLVDAGFGQSTTNPADQSAQNVRTELGATPVANVPTAEAQSSADPVPRVSPADFDPNAVEPPRRPRSSFADDAGSTFASAESADPIVREPNETGTNRNTFIEAARRAAQRQNLEVETADTSLVARVMAKLKPQKLEEHAPEAFDAETDEPAPGGLRARLAGLGRKKDKLDAEIPQAEPTYQMDGAYEEPYEDEDTQPSFLSKHKRPLLLAGLLITVSLLALNLVERRMNSGPSTIEQTPPETTQFPSTEPSGMLSQPLLDPQPTGSIDPFVRQIPGTGMPDQLMSMPLDNAARTLQEGPRVDALKSGAFSIASAPSAQATMKFEMPPEAIGPLALREAAAKGDPRAQFEVAAIFGEGRAVPADSEAAAVWYERAAAQGFAPAEYRIGNIYEHGQGVTKDVAQAKIWYERAAEAGNRMSMHNLAAIYASGALGKQQFTKASEWFERAAGLGLTDSQFNLGMLHARGLGVPQDMATSYKWFSLAASRGDDGAAKARDDVARSLDADTINRLRSELANWRPLDINLASNFAPIGTWAEDFNPGNTIGDKNVVKEVQSALNRLGYDVGTPDGLMGPRTRDAIATFERSTGMNESGAVNPRLLAVLGSQPV